MSVIAALALMQAVPLDAIETYDRNDWDRTVTQCDVVIGHPDDPEAVTGGVEREAADLPAAIEACEAAVAADPENPRLNYQLARAYGYSGMHAEAQPHRDVALTAGYPQSLFVVGYIRLIGWDGQDPDPCYGGELIRLSAEAGRFAGLVGFPHYALSGAFEGCETYPVVDDAEMLGFLDAAEAQTGDFYRTALIEQMRARITE
ncbi:MAG: hypothetical protein ABL308_04635 [Oceanicaulis sp.]